MSLPMNAQCYVCQMKKNAEVVERLAGMEAATAFCRELMALYLAAPKEKGSPWFGPEITRLIQKYCNLTGDRFAEEKAASNRFVMARLDRIRAGIQAAPDPVYAGAQMAVLGNYIDFAALNGNVSFETLDEMLEQALEQKLDLETYRALCRDLETGRSLIYITDNAGEIGFDRLFAEAIAEKYPHLSITFCVRGGNAANDATRADAEAVGLPFPVIDNGCCVAGTELELLGEEARAAFDHADIFLSKGQGNTETLWGCGLNIYFLFLVKCQRFIDEFQKPQFTPMLTKYKE